MTQPSYKHSYDIHGIVRIQSVGKLPELEFFRVKQLTDAPDIVIDTQRRASKTPATKHVHYDDGLGKLGFSIDIDYAQPIQITASPLITLSPHVLYTNVIEPLLRWTFVQKGYALIHAACLSFDGKAVLVTAKTDTGKTSTIILTSKNTPSCQFLSDDMTLVSRDGKVLSYPKPMTISFHTLRAAKTAPLPLLNRIALQIQSRLHSKSGRKVGLKLGNSKFPAASLNALVQMIIPPPKYMIDRLVPGARYVKTARLDQVMVIERGPDQEIPLNHAEIVEELSVNAEDAYGFPPYPIIGHQLYTWNGEDLHRLERAIVSAALTGCQARLVRSTNFGWWKRMPELVGSSTQSNPMPSTLNNDSSAIDSTHPQGAFAN